MWEAPVNGDYFFARDESRFAVERKRVDTIGSLPAGMRDGRGNAAASGGYGFCLASYCGVP